MFGRLMLTGLFLLAAAGLASSEEPARTPPAPDKTVAELKLSALKARLRALQAEQEAIDAEIRLLEHDSAKKNELDKQGEMNRRDNEDAMKAIEKIRGLKFSYPVASIVLPDEEFEQTARPLLGNGLKDIRGVYVSDHKRLYMRRYDANPLMSWTLRIHETTHALTDQNFDLKKLHDRAGDSDDAQRALTGLIEGEAVIVMMKAGELTPERYRAPQKDKNAGGDWQQRMLSDPPNVAQMSARDEAAYRERAFDYRYGAVFVNTLVEKGNGAFDLVNKAYTDALPLSTEQILHPDKYFAREAPVKVELPLLLDELGPDWKLTGNHVSGEFGTFLYLLRHEASRKLAEKASAGWGGDCYHTYYLSAKEGAKPAFVSVWKSLWDSNGDAQEFFAAALAMFTETYPKMEAINKPEPAAVQKNSAAGLWKLPNGNRLFLTIRGNEVLVLEDVPEKAFEAVMKKFAPPKP